MILIMMRQSGVDIIGQSQGSNHLCPIIFYCQQFVFKSYVFIVPLLAIVTNAKSTVIICSTEQ